MGAVMRFVHVDSGSHALHCDGQAYEFPSMEFHNRKSTQWVGKGYLRLRLWLDLM